MRKSLAISAGAHAAVLAWGALTFATKPYKVDLTEAWPVDIISASEFSQRTAGTKTGTQDNPNPLADKVGEKNTQDDPTAKVAKGPEIKATSETPPVLEDKPPAPAPKAKSQPNRDLIAETLKKEKPKKPDTKKSEAAVPQPPKRPPQPAVPAFDPKQVMALLDKRTPQRQAATNDTVNNSAPRGVPGGQAAQVSASELEALRARLAQLWSPPAGAKNPEELIVQVRVLLSPDGRLAAPPMVLTSGSSPLFLAARESAVRALFRGQPFDMLRPEHYEQWKDVEITFDPRFMFRG